MELLLDIKDLLVNITKRKHLIPTRHTNLRLSICTCAHIIIQKQRIEMQHLLKLSLGVESSVELSPLMYCWPLWYMWMSLISLVGVSAVSMVVVMPPLLVPSSFSDRALAPVWPLASYVMLHNAFLDLSQTIAGVRWPCPEWRVVDLVILASAELQQGIQSSEDAQACRNDLWHVSTLGL